MSNNSLTVSKKQEISGNEKKKPGQKDQSAQSARLVQNMNSADPNCISDLKSVIQELRLEIQCIMEEQQKELVAQLNIQKGDMLQREAILHSQINSLKNDMESLSEKLRQLLQTESERKLELEKLSSEREHLLEMLTELQRERDEKDLCIHCSVNKSKVTNV